MSRQLALGLLVALLVMAPVAGAHVIAPSPPPGGTATQESELAPPTAGYTGPGKVPYLSFFDGTWLYGQSSSTPIGKQQPRQIFGSGDWLVWEDAARGRIYAYNVGAGSGFYLGNGTAIQRNPAISGTTVVWEEYRPRESGQIWSYDLATGELRQVTRGGRNHANPSIDGTLVAYEDEANGTTRIFAYDFANDTTFPVYVTTDKAQDPLVVGHDVYFRTFRFDVWDVMGADVSPNGTGVFQVTADSRIQGAPFTNGRGVYFLDQYLDYTWTLARYDASAGQPMETSIHLQDAAPTPLSDDRMLQVVHDASYAQLVARNVTTGTTTHVSGDLALIGAPYLAGTTAYMALHTANGTSLLALDVSPFAFGKPPSLTITSPGALYPWLRPVVVTGLLATGPGWSEPVTFTYQVDGAPPIAVPPSAAWRVTLDNAEQAAGAHRVTFRATFREGPPVSASLTLQVPSPAATVDVGQAGQQFHSARVLGAFNQFIVTNPASYVVLVIGLAILIIVLVRLWLAFRASRAKYVVEYVAPEE
ncbi:MAG: hypothetical protein QOE90_414 [Thermoplasmata archaeon]|nr:hypothetical protein [Thermoplasmata archaeon]